MTDDIRWKTEQYHGHDMHVLAQRRAIDNPDLPGHGEQWDFTVKVTPPSAGPASGQAETACSERDIFYSTQAIAENMGFLKGREIVEGRIGGAPGAAAAGAAAPGGRTL